MHKIYSKIWTWLRRSSPSRLLKSKKKKLKERRQRKSKQRNLPRNLHLRRLQLHRKYCAAKITTRCLESREMQMITHWKKHIARKQLKSTQTKTMLRKLVKRSRKWMQQWHAFLIHRNVANTTNLGVWMPLRGRNQTQVVVAVVAIMDMVSVMLTSRMSSCHQKISSISCSLVKSLHVVEVSKGSVIHNIITNNRDIPNAKRGMWTRVNYYFANLVHSSFSSWSPFFQVCSAVVFSIKVVQHILTLSNVPTNTEKSSSPID